MADTDKKPFEMLPVSEVGVGAAESAIGQRLSDVVWPAGTKLTLTNVEWDSDYNNVVDFGTVERRNEYFEGAASSGVSTTLNACTYAFPGAPVRVDLPYHAAYTYNYLVVENPRLPIDGEPDAIPVFYYFIQDVAYIAPNTTELTLQLDVWMTYRFVMRLGRAFVERGHVAKHAYENSQLETNEKKRRYLTAPEGLDVGNAYQITNESIYTMGGGLDGGATEWTVIITSAVDIECDDPAATFGTPKDPKLKMADGMIVDGVPSGCQVWGMEVHNFLEFCKVISDYPWISTSILSITAMPEGCITHDGNTKIAGVAAYHIKSQNIDMTGSGSGSGFAYQRPSGGVDAFLAANVTESWDAEPKARVYPYSYIAVDNMCSTPLLLKPEAFYKDEAEWAHVFTVCPPFQRIFAYPVNYGLAGEVTKTTREYKKFRLGDTNATTQEYPLGQTLANALTWSEFPSFSILNDSYINYMASNANSLQYMRNNAGWIKDRTVEAARVNYANASRSIEAASTAQGLRYDYQKTGAQGTLQGNLTTRIGSALSSGYSAAGYNTDKATDALGKLGLNDNTSGMLANFAGNLSATAGMIQNTTDYTTGIAMANMQQKSFDVTKGAERANANANRKLANWAAAGDYRQAIAQINATTQDAELLPPTQSGVAGGGMYAVLGALALTNYYMTANTVNPQYQAVISSYWQRYGYAVQEYVEIGDNISLMTCFTYWACQDVIVTGDEIGEPYRLAIKGIFEKGVTVYRDPADIVAGVDIMTQNAPEQGEPIY